MLHHAVSPFVNMTFESHPVVGKIGPFVGLDYEIGLFWGTGLVVSLTYILNDKKPPLDIFSNISAYIKHT